MTFTKMVHMTVSQSTTSMFKGQLSLGNYNYLVEVKEECANSYKKPTLTTGRRWNVNTGLRCPSHTSTYSYVAIHPGLCSKTLQRHKNFTLHHTPPLHLRENSHYSNDYKRFLFQQFLFPCFLVSTFCGILLPLVTPTRIHW